ncbi:YecA family protein [Vibrio maerlii]|uniref:YecA family protein n=1 Tax=Vibrio maerlii TaxID=2231648 RepID=UPI000E3C378C|nr:SEC-C metal-binding domain-containing protein [Vibrio maerlii]
MTYQTLDLSSLDTDYAGFFFEGAIFASNLATKPLDPKEWLPNLVAGVSEELESLVTEQINRQHNLIQRSEYSLSSLLEGDDALAEFAEGFMNVWPVVSEQWDFEKLSDGTARMLQALLTTLMLAIDEESTQQQMRDAGMDDVPSLSDFTDQLDVMVTEVALAADEQMLGNKAQSVNPFKGTGRNDPCPCGSGKKFKKCCGK